MKVGVFGSSKVDDAIAVKAKRIGEVLAEKNHIIITGGSNGYPHIVAVAAMKAGGKTISYAVGLSRGDHATFHATDLSEYEEVVFQKEYFHKELHGIDNYARSLKMCFDVDTAIVIGGRVGTLYELAILSGLGKDVLILKGSGGISNKTAEAFVEEGHKGKSSIVFFESPEELYSLL